MCNALLNVYNLIKSDKLSDKEINDLEGIEKRLRGIFEVYDKEMELIEKRVNEMFDSNSDV